ncbi:uncharacterized protein LOC144438052 [Glandiceps talaboti]
MSEKRVIVWSAPRCLSSVFLRVISNSPGVKAYHELYSWAYHYGEERLSGRYNSQPIIPGFKFGDVKNTLDGPHRKGESVVLKDIAHRVLTRLDSIPSGYQHTFLIRNPTKSIVSLYKLGQRFPQDCNGDHLPSDNGGSQPMWKMYSYLVSHVTNGEPIIVVDADDLQRDPSGMFRKYCDAVGLDYDDSMLCWSAGDRPYYMDSCTDYDHWFQNVFESDGFKQSLSDHTTNLSTLPIKVQQTIEESMPYYKMLHDLRLRLE